MILLNEKGNRDSTLLPFEIISYFYLIYYFKFTPLLYTIGFFFSDFPVSKDPTNKNVGIEESPTIKSQSLA